MPVETVNAHGLAPVRTVNAGAPQGVAPGPTTLQVARPPSASRTLTKMRPIRVPLKQRPAFCLLARLEETAFSAILSAVAPVGETIARSQIVAAAGQSGEIDDDDAALLLTALLEAHAVTRGRRASPGDVATSIADDSSLELQASERSVLRDRLTALLEVDQLALLSRAAQLIAEDAHTFCAALTISDLRPVFAIDVEPPEPAGMAVTHSLKIYYHNDGPERETFTVRLDERALRDLGAVLGRALEKGHALRNMASKSGLPIIDVEQNH